MNTASQYTPSEWLDAQKNKDEHNRSLAKRAHLREAVTSMLTDKIFHEKHLNSTLIENYKKGVLDYQSFFVQKTHYLINCGVTIPEALYTRESNWTMGQVRNEFEQLLKLLED